MNNKIVIVGSLNADITAYCERFPVSGETVLGTSLRVGPGGKGSNQATAAARQGGQVVMISKLGNDLFSRVLSDHYQKEGMDTRYIIVDPDAQTGSALIAVDQAGHNQIIVIKGANGGITAAEVAGAESEFASCGVVLTQLETSMESVLECKRLALKYQKPLILNPAPYQELPGGLLAGVDYLTPNETEAASLTGLPLENEGDGARCALKLISMGVKNVIITLGARGAYVHDGESGILIPPPDVSPIDTVGAGDAFNGGLAVALAQRRPLIEAVRLANCVAAISITRPGASEAMPYRGEALELMKRFYGS